MRRTDYVERGLASAVPRVHIRSGSEEDFNHGGTRARLDRPAKSDCADATPYCHITDLVERGLADAVPRAHIRPGSEEDFNHGGTRACLGRPVKGGFAAEITCCHTRAGLEQGRQHAGVGAGFGRPMQGGFTASPGRHIRTGFEQGADESLVVAPNSESQRGPVLVVACVGVGTGPEERVRDLQRIGHIGVERQGMQRSPASVVPGVHVRARTDEQLDNGRLGCIPTPYLPFRPDQGRCFLVVSRVDIRTGLQQKRDDLVVASDNRVMERGPALFFVAGVGIRPSIKEHSRRRRPSVRGRQDQRGLSLVVDRSDIRTRLHEKGRFGSVLVHRRMVDRGVSVGVMAQAAEAGMYIRARREAAGHRLGRGRGGEPRRVPVLAVSGIGDHSPVVARQRVRARDQQRAGHGGVVVAEGRMKRSATVRVPCVHVRAALDECGDDGEVLRLGRVVQRGCPRPVPGVDVRAASQQGQNDSDVPFPAQRLVQGRVVLEVA